MMLSDRDAIAARLRTFAWPGEMWGDLIGPLMAQGRIVDLEAGQWVQAEGDEDTGVFVVLSGGVQVLCKARGDREAMITQLGPGAALGQTGRFGGGPRLLTVICQARTRLLVVSDRALARIGAEAPRMWEAVTALLYLSLRDLLQALADATALPPRARLAARLQLLARGLPAPRRLSVTQQTLGEFVGLTRKTVNAYLAEFERAGLVRRVYGGVEVLDPAGLERAAAT